MQRKSFHNNNLSPKKRNRQKKQNFKKKNIKSKNKTEGGLKWVDEICKDVHNLEEQFSLILMQIQAPQQYYNTVSQIVIDLTQIVKQQWPNHHVSVEPFGSAITKLALQDSDVDLYIDFNEKLPNVSQILKKIIGKNRNFHRVMAIEARVPLIRCVHTSKIMCDISFTNSIGVANSKLIKVLFQTDERLRPLNLLIRVLMKENGLVHKKVITNHILTLLIIYFLQQMEKPILPPIELLQNHAEQKKIIDNWNVAFTTDPNHLPKSENDMTILQLIKNFFSFYSKFDFGFYVISVYTGKAYLKSKFSNVDMLPDEFGSYKENLKNGLIPEFDYMKPGCVQDLFAHNNNVMRNIYLDTLIKFQMFCRHFLTVFEDTESKNTPPKMMLNKLLKSVHLNSNNHSDDFNRAIFVGGKVDFKESKADADDDMVTYWSEHVIDKLLKILGRVLRCEFAVRDPKNCSENLVDLYPSNNLFKYIECKFFQVQLIGNLRKEAKQSFEFPTDLCPLMKEELVSEYLWETFLKDKPEESIRFSVQCYLMRNPTRININFTSFETIKSKVRLSCEAFTIIKSSFIKLLQSIV